MIAATNGKVLFPLDRGKPTIKTGLKLTNFKTDAPLLSRVFEMAAQNDVRQLWALPGSSLHKQLAKLSAVPKGCGWTIKPDKPELIEKANYWTAWHPGQKAIQLVAPGMKGGDWKLDTVADPELWSEVVKLFIKYLQIGPSIPIRTARKLAEQVTKKLWLDHGPEDLAPFVECTEHDLTYKAELPGPPYCRPAAFGAKWLHVYDKRNAYLSAAGALLGVGSTAERVQAQTYFPDRLEFSPSRPGIWQCEIDKPISSGSWDVITGDAPSFAGWFYTPMVQYFQQRGYNVRIKRATLFYSGHRVLEPMYKVIRQALAAIPGDDRFSLEARSVAVKCLKSCYTQFIGWLGRTVPGAYPGPFYRPDWRHTIIAESKARIALNIDKAMQASGGRCKPVGVRVDSVMFLSDEPDPQKAVPAPFTGSDVYRVKYSVPGPVAMELLTDRGLSIQKIDDLLKKESERNTK